METEIIEPHPLLIEYLEIASGLFCDFDGSKKEFIDLITNISLSKLSITFCNESILGVDIGNTICFLNFDNSFCWK
jgi:hypothetical protein